MRATVLYIYNSFLVLVDGASIQFWLAIRPI